MATKVTKNDMARVVVQALYNLPALPAASHSEVVKRACAGTLESLTRHHALAVRALNSVKPVS